MSESRRKFDQDFEEGAVPLVRKTGRPIAQIAHELGASQHDHHHITIANHAILTRITTL